MRLFAAPPRLVGAVTIALLLVFAATVVRLEHVRRPREGVPATIEGVFPEHGATPHGQVAPDGEPFWSSWAGNDDHRGSVVLGPFPASRRMGLHVSGYPRSGNNSIRVLNHETGESVSLQIENVGETWAPVNLDIPESWRHKRISIVATDDAVGMAGWLAVSRPFASPWWAVWARGFPYRLMGFISTLVVSGILVMAAAKLLVSLGAVQRESIYLLPAGVGVVSFLGYAFFWIGIASTVAMTALAWIAIVLAAFVCAMPAPRWRVSVQDYVQPANDVATAAHGTLIANRWLIWRTRTPASEPARRRTETSWIAACIVICSLFSFTVLNLVPHAGLLSDLARSRWMESPLPSDNTIPQHLAERVLKGEPANSPFGDWLSSDRPPLQSAWILAVVKPVLSLGFDYDTAAQAAGMVLQSLAIAAAWALLRRLGASMTLTAAVICSVVPSGFMCLGLTFVWPKLVGGAFVLLAFLLWFGHDGARASGVRHRFILAGLFAGLAWLCHGGTAFALIAAAPFALASCLRHGWRPWIASAAAFLILALPWVAYQKFYDPPGNRLVKWHLAGVIPIDDRGALETLVQSYRELSVDDWLTRRAQNLHSLTHGRWKEFATFSFVDRQGRRSDEFFHSGFALGWWNLGLLSLPWLWFLKRPPPVERDMAVRVVLWTLATLAVWVLLIFIGGHTVIHQGSYSTLLVLFPLLAWALFQTHPLLWAATFAAQAYAFARLWMAPRDPAAGQQLLAAPLVVLGVTVVAAAVMVALIRRSERTAPAPVICDPTAA